MGFKINDDSIYLSKIGEVYMVKHRELEGDVKRVCIRRKNNKWYACITVGVPSVEKVHTQKAVGVDVGLESFATLSAGEKIANPRFFREEEKALAKAQRKLSKTEKNAPERVKARKVVSRIYERICNRRNDFVHQLSHKLVNRFGLIVFEDLNIKNMVENHRLAKSISDAAWRMLINATRYKAESAGTKVVLVNPANTSKMCSRCGQIVEMDRDENAAINILRLGLQSVAKA